MGKKCIFIFIIFLLKFNISFKLLILVMDHISKSNTYDIF